MGELHGEQLRPQSLSPAAAEVLLRAVNGKGGEMGSILVFRTRGGFQIVPGGHSGLYDATDPRATAKYKAALEELESLGLVDFRSEAMREVTHQGYLVADEVAAQSSS